MQLQFPHTYTEVRQIAAAALLGTAWRRLPLWRYAITWQPYALIWIHLALRCRLGTGFAFGLLRMGD